MKKWHTVTRMKLPVDRIFLVKLWKWLQSFLLSVIYELLWHCKKVILEERTFHVRRHLIRRLQCSWVVVLWWQVKADLSKELLCVNFGWTISDLLLVHFNKVDFFNLSCLFDSLIHLLLNFKYFKGFKIFLNDFTCRCFILYTHIFFLFLLFDRSRSLRFLGAPSSGSKWDPMLGYPLLILICTHYFEWRLSCHFNQPDPSLLRLAFPIALSLRGLTLLHFFLDRCSLNFWKTLFLRD